MGGGGVMRHNAQVECRYSLKCIIFLLLCESNAHLLINHIQAFNCAGVGSVKNPNPCLKV